MGQISTKTGRIAAWIYAAAVLLLPLHNAVADNFLGFYVGGAVGQAHVDASGEQFIANGQSYAAAGSFDQNHSAFKVMAGIRPIPLLGAEVAYMDFGHPGGGYNAYPASVKMHGESAFGVLYLPVPIVDVFLKAGIARLQSDIRGTTEITPYCGGPSYGCPQYIAIGSFQLDRTDTRLALGGGAQYKFGPLAVRAEYERFSAAEEHPTLLSVGLTWSF